MFSSFLIGKVFVCIDAANVESSVKDLQWHIDYRRLRGLFAPERLFAIRSYCVRHGTQNQDAFFTVLKRLGYGLVTKPLKQINDAVGGIIRKANFDVEIAVDAMDALDRFDTFMLFSGDSDFAYLARRLRRHGKRVMVVSTRYHIARELVEAANKYLDLRHLKPLIART